jgi:hypothetical protein
MTVIHMEGKASEVFARFRAYAEANPNLTLGELAWIRMN